MTLKPGQTINGRYFILKQISQGGFGFIHLALDSTAAETSAQQLVVIKESKTDDQDGRDSLLEEIKLLSQLQHPHMPRIYDFFYSEEQRLCIVMEYILGANLEHFYEHDQRPEVTTALNWISQILEVLKLMHTHNPPIVHRDVKLGNIQIHAVTNQAYLLDFGIAKSGSHTRIPAYTPPYAPPEQYRMGQTTPATDVYAVGVCLYMLLTGEEPPEGIARGEEVLVPPREISLSIPLVLEQVILKALAIEPAQRYRDAGEMAEAFVRVKSTLSTKMISGMPIASSPDELRLSQANLSHPHAHVVRSQKSHQLRALKVARKNAIAQSVKGTEHRDTIYRQLLKRRRKRIRTMLEQIKTNKNLLRRRKTQIIAGLRRERALDLQIGTLMHQHNSNPLLALWTHTLFRRTGTGLIVCCFLAMVLIPPSLRPQTLQVSSLLLGSYPLIYLAIITFMKIRQSNWQWHRQGGYWIVGCLIYGLFISMVSFGLTMLMPTDLYQKFILDLKTSMLLMITQGLVTGILTAGLKDSK